MKKVILTISALMISAMISTGAFATVPDLIPVQGVLADSADLPIDGLTDITFNLYDVETGGTALWTDTFVDVDVVEGFFTVYLGSDTALDFASLISSPEIWVGMTVESDPEMDRLQLATVPFAIEAQVSQMVGTLSEGDIITTSDPAGGIAAGDITNWDTAYGWGDHSVEGYLTSYTETDPVFSVAPAAGIAAGDITNWNTAFGWGDHSGLYAPLSHNHDATYVNVTGDTMTGNLNMNNNLIQNIGNAGTDFTSGGGLTAAGNIAVVRPDTEISQISAMGTSQGSGVVYVGQSGTYGGGMVYDGDGTPALVGGTDRITFYRRNGGVDTEVFSYSYTSNTVTFAGDISAPNNTRESCSWTGQFSEENAAMYCPVGKYVAGMECWDSYCDNVALYCCEL